MSERVTIEMSCQVTSIKMGVKLKWLKIHSLCILGYNKCGVAAPLDTYTHTNISTSTAESCSTLHHAVKLMGAAAHIDRQSDWQTHKDALQSRLSQLPFCAGPVLSLACTLLFILLWKAMCSFKKGPCLKNKSWVLSYIYIYMLVSIYFFVSFLFLLFV